MDADARADVVADRNHPQLRLVVAEDIGTGGVKVPGELPQV
ncbi:MAG: hypothetical protein U1E97_07155 [Alphaproteobacteria bacterium]